MIDWHASSSVWHQLTPSLLHYHTTPQTHKPPTTTNTSGGNWEWNQWNERTYMGYSVRTDEWRYTVWVQWNSTTYSPMWDQPFGGEELYDHRDPRCNEKGNFDLCENRNVAQDESLKAVKEEMYAKLRSVTHDTFSLNAWEKLRAETEAAAKEGNAEARTRLFLRS